ncbi:MAG: LUD domain-containing protein [Candidatus Bathyarchaeia archaeon]
MDSTGLEAHERLISEIRDGIADKRRRAQLYLGTEGDREASEKAYAALPNGDWLLQEAQRIKRESLGHLDENVKQFTQAVNASGVQVHFVQDGAAAVRMIIDLARRAGAKRVAKAKSMTSEEIELRQHLEEEGFDVVETDLGERIIQIAHQRPSHITAPALHLTVEQITELFSKNLGRELPPDPGTITAVARESLRSKFLQADVGITGANFALADSGAIVIVSNEGNARLVTALPRMTIAILGSEKIVPNAADAITLLQALILSSAARKLTSYVSIVRGGSKLAQTGQEQEQHVIVIDNGRSRMLADPNFREALYCLRCGACMDTCPTFRLLGGHVFGHVYPGPIGIPWTEYTASPDAAGEFAPLCISCGLCQRVCPEDINIPLLIAQVKERYTERHGQLSINKTLCNYETFVSFASATSPVSNFLLSRKAFRFMLQTFLGLDSRRPFPKFTRHTFKKWFSSRTPSGSRSVAYFVDTYADMCEPEIGKAVVGILEYNDCRVILPKQVGSGIPAFLYGDMKRTARAAEFNVPQLAEAVRSGCEIVSSEPTATYCLKELYPRLLSSDETRLVAAHSHDLFDYLLELHREGKLRNFPRADMQPVAYYSPCHTRSVYGKSNALEILKLAGIDVRPVRYNTCCGIAGTFGFKKGPEGYDVSIAIGETLFERLKALGLSQVITESSVCKMQIEHGTSLPAIHPAVALWNLCQASRS